MNILLPEAKRLNDDHTTIREKTKDNPLAGICRFITEGWLILITFVIAFLSGIIAAILSYLETISNVATFICLIMFGSTVILASVSKKAVVSGTGSPASVRRIFAVIGSLLIIFPIIYVLGPEDNSVGKLINVVLVILVGYLILKGSILTWAQYFLAKKRMQRCTEGAVAHLTDMETGSICAIEPKGDDILKYDYVYEYMGEKYLIRSYEKYNIIKKCGRDLFINVDPSAPEKYYHPDLVFTRTLKGSFEACLTALAFAGALGFIAYLLFYLHG